MKNIDKFIELYMGRYGKFPITKKDSIINLHIYSDENITDFVDKAIIFLTNGISKHINEKDVDLYNIRDEIVGDLNQAKYLFVLQ